MSYNLKSYCNELFSSVSFFEPLDVTVDVVEVLVVDFGQPLHEYLETFEVQYTFLVDVSTQ